MNSTKCKAFADIDIDEILRSRGQIADIWSIEDVRSVRPNLSDDQAWNVLKQCIRYHDCNFGFTWSLLEMVADRLYPEIAP